MVELPIHPRADLLVGQAVFLAVADAPEPRVVDSPDQRPVLRVDHEVAVEEGVRVEVVVDVGADELFRVGEAREGDQEKMAGGGFTTVGADGVGAA